MEDQSKDKNGDVCVCVFILKGFGILSQKPQERSLIYSGGILVRKPMALFLCEGTPTPALLSYAWASLVSLSRPALTYSHSGLAWGNGDTADH